MVEYVTLLQYNIRTLMACFINTMFSTLLNYNTMASLENCF